MIKFSFINMGMTRTAEILFHLEFLSIIQLTKAWSCKIVLKFLGLKSNRFDLSHYIKGECVSVAKMVCFF